MPNDVQVITHDIGAEFNSSKYLGTANGGNERGKACKSTLLKTECVNYINFNVTAFKSLCHPVTISTLLTIFAPLKKLVTDVGPGDK